MVGVSLLVERLSRNLQYPHINHKIIYRRVLVSSGSSAGVAGCSTVDCPRTRYPGTITGTGTRYVCWYRWCMLMGSYVCTYVQRLSVELSEYYEITALASDSMRVTDCSIGGKTALR
jgi:hypothetical protein